MFQPRVRRSSKIRIFILTIGLLSHVSLTNLSAQQQDEVKQNFNMWTVFRFTHNVNTKWSYAFQTEIRLFNKLEDVNQIILKPYGHYSFNKVLSLSAGYKYIYRPADTPDEHDLWQEFVISQEVGKWFLDHQIRLEERFYQGISGIIPRLRYLLNYNVGLGEKSPFYITGFGAVRFNLVDKGEGPVGGFEQVRVTALLGLHHGPRTRLELGYLYRYEVNRNAPAFSDHAIHFHLFFNLDEIQRRPGNKYNFL